MIFFSETISSRFHKDEVKSINKILRTNKDLYDSQSHFLRCAVIKLINEHHKEWDLFIS